MPPMPVRPTREDTLGCTNEFGTLEICSAPEHWALVGGTVTQLQAAGVTSPWRIHAVLLVTVALTLTGVSIVNVALPTIRQSLGASDVDLQWVLAGYALSFGVTLIPAGRLGDLFGRTGLYVTGIMIFAGASILAGLADDILVLNLARVIQGLGSGILMPQILGIIQQLFQGAKRARAMGAYGTVVAVSMGAAPLLGGFIIELAGGQNGWRWTFFINVPISVLALVLVLAWFPRPFMTKNRESVSRRLDLDLIGAALLSLSLLSFLLPFASPIGGPIWLLLPLGISLLWCWVVWERRYKERGRQPMVDLHAFADRGFASGVLLATVYFFGITSVWVIVAIYLQLGLGFSALDAGLVGLPSAVIGALAARWAGKRSAERRRLMVSVGVMMSLSGLVATVGVLVLSANGVLSVWWITVTLISVGLAQGTVISPNQVLTLSSVPISYAGSSAGVLYTGQRVGAAIGVAVITAILFAVQPVSGWTMAAAAAFAGVVISLLVALIISLRDQFRRQRRGDTHMRHEGIEP